MQKKLSFFIGLLILSLLATSAFGQGFDVQFTQNRSDVFTLDVNLEKYDVQIVEKDGQMFSKLQFAGDINSSKAGWAELPYVSIPVQLSSDRNVDVEIIESSYVDISLVEPMLPSRGVIYRNQDPSEIPYEIDPESIIDAWYPEQLVEDGEPYILRKVRGQNIRLQPFRYNEVKQTLRVYTKLRVRVSENTEDPINALPAMLGDVNVEMAPVYRSIFKNYNQNPTRWTEEIGEFGDVLVIYTSRDATVIQPWIEWKQQKGYQVDELQVATGTNVGADIQSAYNTNSNLLYVLLVGDWAEIKSDLGGSENTPMDPMHGCVAGGDDHHDIIIGRFSAESTADVTAQVNKSIDYEKNPDTGGTWYTKALGIASDEGAGIGDDDEADIDQINNIHDGRLLPSTYTNAYEEYDPGASSATVQNYINDGLSVINYVGHGYNTYWVSSGYDVSDAYAATNGNKLPFAFSVACVVGAFHGSSECFAEAMLRNPNGGSIGTWMATMNQPWQPPMRGQDYANDLLVQGYGYSLGSGTATTYGRTTFGSITFNAAELMIAESGASADWDTYKTWTIFGDPSFQVRTDQPKAISLSNMSVSPGTYTTQVNVEGSGFEGAIVSLWQAGSQPASAMTDASGNVSINHSFTGTVKLTVTGFNLDTYHEDHPVAVPDPPVCDFSADQTTITAGETVQFTDISTNYPTTWSWTFDGGNPASSTTQNPAVTYDTPGTYDVSLYVTNNAGNDTETKVAYITVNPITDPPVSDFVADQTSISIGETVNFTDLSTNMADAWDWTFEGGTPATSTNQNPSVQYDAPGTYTVTLVASNSYGVGNTETKIDYITVSLPDYCDASGGDAGYEYIANVVLGTIDNASDGQAYTDFTSITTDAYPEDNLNLVITNGSTDYDTDQAFAWADWNRDGDFDDANEDLFVSPIGVGPYSTNITVPAGTASGPVRVRLRLEDSEFTPTAAPCGHSSYGEVEDYTINIQVVEIPPTASFSASPTSTCDGIVQFTDASLNAESWSWDFGDGNTSTAQNPLHNYVTNGTYTVELTVTNSMGSDIYTETDYINVDMPVAPTVTDAENCGPGDMTLTASGTGTLNWYDAPTGGNLINTGTSLTDNFAATTNYFVENEVAGVTYATGKLDNTGTGGFFGNVDFVHGLIFDAYTEFTINSVKVYADGAKDRVINLKNEAGTIIETRTVSVPDGESRIDLNITVPAGVNYILECDGDADLYRNSAGASYPYEITDVLSIHYNTADDANYYYYFYDWEIAEGSCISARIPVTATVHDFPTVDLGADQTICETNDETFDAGSGFSNYAWSNGSNSQNITVNTADVYSVTVTDEYGCMGDDEVELFIDEMPDATITVDADLCENEAPITLTAVTPGGTWIGIDVSGDQFNPSNGEGDYIVYYDVVNGECAAASEATIHVDASPDATIDPIGPFCTGDAAVTLTAATTGGTWTGDGVSGNTFDPVAAGIGAHTINYSVENGTCTAFDQIEVLVADSFDASIDAVDPLCENSDPITLTAATPGGDWSGTGITGNQFDPSVAGAGNHLVSYTVGTGTCEDSDNILISVEALPEIEITNPNAICLSEISMTLTADVADGTWSGTGVSGDVFNAETAGIGVHTITYEVIVGACTMIETIDISVGDAPTVNVDVTNASASTVADGSASADVSDGLAPYTYAWSSGDGDATMEDVAAGDYSLTVTDAAGCETVVANIVIDFTNSIAEESIAYAVYPNPAQNEVYIKLDNMNANSVELINVLGQTVLTRTVEGELTRIDVSRFVSGVYFIRINANDKQFIEKLMID
jgi:PKD repeat protein